MINFFETYECKADSKGRIMIPSGLKSLMDNVLQNGLVLKRSIYKPCIELYPREEWQQIREKLSKLNQFNPEHLAFIRLYTAGVKEVEIDASGRFLIPKLLFDFAKIEKEIVLVPSINFIEIWDKNLYEKEINSINEEDFMRLTEKIMGGNE